jgi:hypothetical protein
MQMKPIRCLVAVVALLVATSAHAQFGGYPTRPNSSAPSPFTIGTNLQLSVTGLTSLRTFTFPDASDTVCGIAATQTLVNKTLNSAGSVTAAVAQAATFQHYLSNGTAPGVAASTGAGTGPTLSLIFGSDTAGLISLTTGTTPTAGGAAVIITYNQSYPGQGSTILLPGNAAAAALSGTSAVYSDSANNASSSWRIMTGSVALAASTVYKWWYVVVR